MTKGGKSYRKEKYFSTESGMKQCRLQYWLPHIPHKPGRHPDQELETTAWLTCISPAKRFFCKQHERTAGSYRLPKNVLAHVCCTVTNLLGTALSPPPCQQQTFSIFWGHRSGAIVKVVTRDDLL